MQNNRTYGTFISYRIASLPVLKQKLNILSAIIIENQQCVKYLTIHSLDKDDNIHKRKAPQISKYGVFLAPSAASLAFLTAKLPDETAITFLSPFKCSSVNNFDGDM